MDVAGIIERWENVIGWLMVAAFCRFVLKWSFKEIFAAVFSEIRDLLRIQLTIGAINALFISLMFFVVFLIGFAPTIGKFLLVSEGALLQPVNYHILFMGIAVSGVISVVCVLRSQK